MDTTNPSSSEGSLKALKIIFFAMMLILIGGAVFLFVSIYERNQGKTSTKTCTEGVIELPVYNEIEQILQEGNIITLLTEERRNRQEVIIFDYCTGRILRQLVLQRNYSGQTNALKEVVKPSSKKASHKE